MNKKTWYNLGFVLLVPEVAPPCGSCGDSSLRTSFRLTFATMIKNYQKTFQGGIELSSIRKSYKQLEAVLHSVKSTNVSSPELREVDSRCIDNLEMGKAKLESQVEHMSNSDSNGPDLAMRGGEACASARVTC